MIFVTVGTHEQSFDRLIKKIDLLKAEGSINEDVYIQSGYSKYVPKYCESKSMLGYDEMCNYVDKAQIVITHGGPGSIFLPIQYGKKPIVVPRNPKFDEHIDKHQMDFSKRMYEKNRIELVLDINELIDKIKNYKNYESTSASSEREIFTRKFNNIITDMFRIND